MNLYLPCDIGGAKELGMMYFPTKCGAKEPQNHQNHRVVIMDGCFSIVFLFDSEMMLFPDLGNL